MPRQHRGEYQTHITHLLPSMGPIVSVVTSHGLQMQLQKSTPVNEAQAQPLVYTLQCLTAR